MRSKFEKRAQRILQKQGYLVDWKLRPSTPSPFYATDYFNLFDLLAFKPSEPIRMISVKGKSVPRSHQEALKSFLCTGCSVELWSFDRNPKKRNTVRCRVRRFVDGKRLEWKEIESS